MKLESIKLAINGKWRIETVTTDTAGFWLWKRDIRTIRVFEATPWLTSHWKWLELPDKLLVPDSLSYQLDAWLDDKLTQGKT